MQGQKRKNNDSLPRLASHAGSATTHGTVTLPQVRTMSHVMRVPVEQSASKDIVSDIWIASKQGYVAKKNCETENCMVYK